MDFPGHILVDRDLRALAGSAILVGDPAAPLVEAQWSPASVDLRLGARGWRMRAGFLPGREGLERTLGHLALAPVDLSRGAVLERGVAYLVELEERLALSLDLRARFNPRSSTGRCDIFTRVLCEGHPRFDETPAGYHGRLWIEIAPLSFPVRLSRGDRLAQLRLSRGDAACGRDELLALWESTPLLWTRGPRGSRAVAPEEARIDADGALELSLGLLGRDPSGWRSVSGAGEVEFDREGAHDPGGYWQPVRAEDGRCILAPGSFHIFASKERLVVPPSHAAEMLPIDVGIGELRNNYAGFFDNGFGWRDGGDGTPAVLEVRAHDVPFLAEDGQPFCRLRFFRARGRPDKLYGEGRASYQDQDLTLARCFRAQGRG
jgi:dCTP deaminase